MSGELIEVERRLNDAVLRGDKEALAGSVLPAFRFMGSDTLLLDGPSWIESQTANLTWDSVVLEEAEAHVDGDAGAVVGRLVQRGAMGELKIEGVFSVADTWLRRDGRWMLAARVALRRPG